MAAHEHRSAECGVVVGLERLHRDEVQVKPLGDLLGGQAGKFPLAPEPRARVRGQFGNLCLRLAHCCARSASRRSLISDDIGKSFLMRSAYKAACAVAPSAVSIR